MPIEWAHAAREDLRAINRYIAQDSRHYARQFANRLIAHTEQPTAFPRIGREVPEATNSAAEIRELLFRDYRIIYQLKPDDQVQILAVIHGARDLTEDNGNPWK